MEKKAVKKKIIIVEDEGYIHELLNYLLTQNNGYEVLTATDGQKGLETILEEHPDLVFLDLMLPGLDGIEVCRKLKENEQTRHIPVVLMSANTKLREQAKKDVGADYVLPKPFNMTEVLELVEKFTSGR